MHIQEAVEKLLRVNVEQEWAQRLYGAPVSVDPIVAIWERLDVLTTIEQHRLMAEQEAANEQIRRKNFRLNSDRHGAEAGAGGSGQTKD